MKQNKIRSKLLEYFGWEGKDVSLSNAETILNKSNAVFLILVGSALVLWGILGFGSVYQLKSDEALYILLAGLLMLVMAIICLLFKGKGKWLKYLMVTVFTAGAVIPIIFYGPGCFIFLIFPLLVGGRYYFSGVTFIFTFILMIIGSFIATIFSAMYGTITYTVENSIIFYAIPIIILLILTAIICYLTAKRINIIISREAKSFEKSVRLDSELKLANEIQTNLVPNNFDVLNKNEFDVYAFMRPSKEVGGDFYDLFTVDKTHVALVMADVSGKGVPAALFMARTKAAIKIYAQLGLSPNEVFKRVNTSLIEGDEAGLFVTAWLGVLDITTGNIVYANAGHTPPLIYHNGKFEYLKAKVNLVLAGLDDTNYLKQEIKLDAKDRIFLYTDGVTEAINKDNEQYGESRLLSFINKNKNLTSEEFINALFKDIDEFAAGADQFDDITMLGLKINKLHGHESNTVRSFPAKDDYLEAVNDFVHETLSKYKLSDDVINHIDLSVEEIFVNISHYAYPLGTGEIKVSISVNKNEITLSFADSGIPFDPLSKADPDISLSADERQIGGLGIFLVKKLMDEVKYEYKDENNILTLKKKF